MMRNENKSILIERNYLDFWSIFNLGPTLTCFEGAIYPRSLINYGWNSIIIKIWPSSVRFCQIGMGCDHLGSIFPSIRIFRRIPESNDHFRFWNQKNRYLLIRSKIKTVWLSLCWLSLWVDTVYSIVKSLAFTRPKNWANRGIGGMLKVSYNVINIQ